MRVLCACGAYKINPESATYVRNGVPMCHEETCRKVAERRNDVEGEARRAEMRRLETREPYADACV